MLKPLFLKCTFIVMLCLLFVDGFGQATLPVSINTISRNSLPTGFSHIGLGSDYAGPKLKFDDQGDNLILYFNSIPGSLSFDVGINNNFSTNIPNNATFSVYESVNGSSYTLVSTYSNTPTGTKSISSLSPGSRYIKWEYSLKPSGSNIALFNINLTSGSPPCSAEPTAQASDITFTDNSSTSADVSWNAGTGGDEYILVAREASPVSFVPIDGTDYSGDTGGGNFSAALDQGSGNKVVYTGTSTSATITGLTTDATYYFQVFNVCTGDSFNYLTATGTGNDGTVGYTVPAFITDDGCDAINYLESTFLYSGGSPIGDVNLFIAITHTYRSDLQIEIESPEGTIVQLLDGSTGGGADNLEVNFDDEAGSPLSSSNHTLDGTADETVFSTTDLLSNFDGEDPNGTWTLRICDDAGGDTGFLDDWSLDISIATIQPEPTNHPTNFDCIAFGFDQIDLIWDDAVGAQVPDGYLIRWSDISLASIPNPVDGTTIPDGSNAQNVPSGDEAYEVTGLTPNTTYYFKIFPYTNSGSNIDYKINGTPLETTCVTDIDPCSIGFGPSFFEDFEEGVVPPSCWVAFEDGAGNGENWKVEADLGSVLNGSFSATVLDDFNGPSSDWLVTPQIQLGTNSYLSFDEIDLYIDTYATQYFIKISTSSQTNTSSFTNLISYNESAFDSGLNNRTIDLSSYDGQLVYIAFVMEGDFDDGWIIDDVVIDELIIKPEPTNHPTNFACFTFGFDEIGLIWDDATGAQLPDGYLVLWSDIGFGSISNPIDGTPFPNGSNAQNVAYGIESLAVTGLNQNTDYYFKIFPYTNSGSSIDYKTNGLIATTSCLTDPGPCALETFDLSNATGSYTDNSFIGNNGITWTYVESRDEGAYSINGDGIMLRQQSDNSKIYSSLIGNGIGDFSCNLRKGFSGGSDRQVELLVNGSPIATSIAWNNSNIQTFNVPGINIAGDVIVEIRNITGNQVVVDDIQWTCYSGCTPTQTISNFYPTEGPSQTVVSVFGTGFTGASDVKFGGVSASSFSVINDTLIKASVSNNGLSGRITVTVAACDKQSVDDFIILDDNGNCGIGGSGSSFATDLFISEVYDASSGSLSYIEVFNGTNSSVLVTNYSIEINTGPSLLYPMSGSISSGETYILRIGSGSSICPGFTVDDDQPSAPGFNGNDIINLLKNGNILDHVPNPGIGSGFSQSRNADVLSPTTSYNASEWTISGTENCNDLGIAPYDPSSSNITISSQPADVDCSTLTFSVAATTNISPNVPTTYTWRYIAPGDLTWSLVSSLNGSNGLTVTGANTPTITITGNTSLLFEYQFYVDMGTGGTGECRKFSNAASYTFDTKAFYRTVSSGGWSDPNIWEMSDTEGGTYEPVCQYPIDRTSDKITIQNGHDVSLDVEIAADWIDICATCTLELEPNMKLTLIDGNSAGPDLIVNGTLIDNGNQANGIEFLDDLPTWEMGVGGTLIKTSSSFATRYRNAYHDGIATIPATSTWIYRFTNSGNLDFASSTSSITMHYPNLILENANSGTYSSSINGSDVFLSDFTMVGSETIIIKGDFNIGGIGVGNINFSNIITSSIPVMVAGQLVVKLGSTLQNTGVNAPEPGTGFELQSDLDISGTLDLSAGTGTGVGVLRLSGAQDMIGVGGTTVIANHIVIDKDPGFNLLADLSLEAEESADFLGGILEFDNAGNSFVFQPLATATSASNTSFVNGRVRKIADVGENFTFPIGDSNSGGDFYQPARIFGQTGQTTIDAQYFNEEHPFAGAYYDGDSNSQFDNQEIGNCDFWTVNKIAGADVQLALTYDNVDPEYCNIVGQPETVFIASLNALNEWDITTSANTAGSEIEMSVRIGSGPGGGSYGDFAFQSSGFNLNILPIELIAFRAQPIDYKVETSWITSSETNNDFFTVERSADADLFYPIGTINGAGSSHHTRTYELTDDRPLPGVSYYRLKQTDFDGASTYSDVKAVFFESAAGFSLEQVYRNENELNLVYKSRSPYVLVEIFDVLGKRVYAELAQNYGGRSIVPVNLNRGAYVVRISNGESSDSGKIVW